MKRLILALLTVALSLSVSATVISDQAAGGVLSSPRTATNQGQADPCNPTVDERGLNAVNVKLARERAAACKDKTVNTSKSNTFREGKPIGGKVSPGISEHTVANGRSEPDETFKASKNGNLRQGREVRGGLAAGLGTITNDDADVSRAKHITYGEDARVKQQTSAPAPAKSTTVNNSKSNSYREQAPAGLAVGAGAATAIIWGRANNPYKDGEGGTARKAGGGVNRSTTINNSKSNNLRSIPENSIERQTPKRDFGDRHVTTDEPAPIGFGGLQDTDRQRVKQLDGRTQRALVGGHDDAGATGPAETAIVKSKSKVTNDREKALTPAAATTVKGSKSNSSERGDGNFLTQQNGKPANGAAGIAVTAEPCAANALGGGKPCKPR